MPLTEADAEVAKLGSGALAAQAEAAAAAPVEVETAGGGASGGRRSARGQGCWRAGGGCRRRNYAATEGVRPTATATSPPPSPRYGCHRRPLPSPSSFFRP
ncbi:hypothetical protein HU200_038598 [Digitaria exilis]|uniref:Uncharacterized protein n=1 Tax=Digitaria exilis TaxID=1010633 RepID=A0A835BCL4_9POAL|nr:hypothetical protein HU200_038598 [Digitaria exilis]